MVNFLSYNVRGLGDSGKRHEVFHYLHLKKADVVFMQDTHGIDKTTKIWSAEWGTKIWSDNYTSEARGVSILFSKQLQVIVHNVETSGEGRFIIIYATLNKKKVLLMNLYAPNADDVEFYARAFEAADKYNPDYHIIGGDFNLAMDSCLDRMGTTHNNDRAANWVRCHLQSHNLIDVWRHLNEDLPGYTWRSYRPKLMFSRLDYFIVSESAIQFLIK